MDMSIKEMAEIEGELELLKKELDRLDIDGVRNKYAELSAELERAKKAEADAYSRYASVQALRRKTERKLNLVRERWDELIG